jgi:hypothetical protein
MLSVRVRDLRRRAVATILLQAPMASAPRATARRMSNTAAHLIDHVIAPDLTL